VSSVTSGGARREIVVLPAPDTPEKRNARPLRTALAECTRNHPRPANIRLCTMRMTESIAYG
jgi:hypothetical protein